MSTATMKMLEYDSKRIPQKNIAIIIFGVSLQAKANIVKIQKNGFKCSQYILSNLTETFYMQQKALQITYSRHCVINSCKII